MRHRRHKHHPRFALHQLSLYEAGQQVGAQVVNLRQGSQDQNLLNMSGISGRHGDIKAPHRNLPTIWHQPLCLALTRDSLSTYENLPNNIPIQDWRSRLIVNYAYA